MNWVIYLSGEIHSDWRQQIEKGALENDLPVTFTSAVTDHAASDTAGDILGEEDLNFWRDHKSSKVNGIRTKTLTRAMRYGGRAFRRQVQTVECGI